MTDTAPPVLTMEAMARDLWWKAARTLPLLENPSIELLDEARVQVIDYLDAASTELALLKKPDKFLADMEAAYQRLIFLSLERAALILAERLERFSGGFSDAALDLHVVARGIK